MLKPVVLRLNKESVKGQVRKMIANWNQYYSVVGAFDM